MRKTDVVVIGAGGAGRAMCSVLAYYGAKKIYITDFFEPCAQALVDDINNNFAPIAEFVHHGDTSKVAEVDVVMNASGVGMGKSIGQSPVDKEILKPNQFCFDACYNPAKTQFLLDAEAQGCKILNGLGMSLYQGAAQIELWTGKKAPVEAMRQELLKTVACKAALKAGIPNAPEHNAWVVERLMEDASLRFCPHGRPVIHPLPRRDMEKFFDR